MNNTLKMRWIVLDPFIATYIILFVAKIIYDKPISWWTVFSPFWILFLIWIVSYGFMWLVTWYAQRTIKNVSQKMIQRTSPARLTSETSPGEQTTI